MILVLGKSIAVINMICDNLESNADFQELVVINNLNLPGNLTNGRSNFVITEKQEPDSTDILTDRFLLGVTGTKTKIALTGFFKLPAEKFISVIHRSAQLSSTVTVGRSVLINSLVSVAAFTRIGNFVTINRNASVGHDAVLEDFVSVGPGAVLCGHTCIGSGTTIAAGTVVIDTVTIGKNCLIGAGSVVTKNLPDNVIAYGNPCKIIRNNVT